MNDRRVYALSLTEEGKKIVDDYGHIVIDSEEALLVPLQAEDELFTTQNIEPANGRAISHISCKLTEMHQHDWMGASLHGIWRIAESKWRWVQSQTEGAFCGINRLEN